MRNTINKLKHAIRTKYAWPGGYALVLLLADGSLLCTTCGKSEFKLILEDTKYGGCDGWAFADIFINWEDKDCYCDHCSNRLPAEYK